jgi:23S rRNA pseudouridine2605 synthase
MAVGKTTPVRWVFLKPKRSSKRPISTIRLQKFLADCGIGSRRACELLISGGRVRVDGRLVVEQGVRIDPAIQHVCVDEIPVLPQKPVHLLLNKPSGYICTSHDEKGRPTIHNLLPTLDVRVYNVGRLDRQSEGLLLVTNDGQLAARLTHPRHHVKKEYLVWIDRVLDDAEILRLKHGIQSSGELLRAAGVWAATAKGPGPCYRIDLREGKNRQLRRMFDALDRTVLRLVRIRLGCLSLGSLKPGQWRHLATSEVDALRKC